MKLGITSVENWEDLNEKIHRALGLSPDVTVRAYQGLHHAAFEVAQGTAMFLSHRRSVGWLKGQTYAYQTTLPFLYKEAFQIQSEILRGNLDLAAWVDSLKKDTNFVMTSDDHPVTGELFEFSDLETRLNDKKIFCFRVSHHAHLLRGYGVSPASVLLCEFGPNLAIAVCGAKFKSPVQMSGYLSWNTEQVLSEIQMRRQQAFEDKEAVLHFESHLPEGFHPVLGAVPRLYDRSVISHPDLNGEAVQTEVLKMMQRPLALPGQDNLIESVSHCRWEFINWDWWENRPSDSVFRGLLLIDARIVSEAGLSEALAKAVSACQI